MLTSAERHFLDQWRDQRQGPKWKYYVTFSVAWTVVSFLAIFFLSKFIMHDRAMGGTTGFLIIAAIAIVIGISSTHLVYSTSENKYLRILQREKNL